jgi:DNA invertase Pin-like site-specific DNA recombinase
MALIGYARVSTNDQNLHLQQDALSDAGCLKIYTDTISGTKSERKGLAEALDFIRDGDTLVVWRLDRLGRSLKDLIERITELHSRNIGFKSLTENIDTTTSGGKLIFHIFGALAEFERDIITERTNAGLTAARARGRQGGRPRSSLSNDRKLQMARQMYENKSLPIRDICKALGIPRSTFYKYMKNHAGKQGGETGLSR